MNGSVVVDASVAVKWLVREAYSDRAVMLSRSWVSQGVRIIAPYLMAVEISNAMYRKVRQRQIDLDSARRLVDNLIGSGLILWEPKGLHSRAMELAAQLRQSAVYDTHYLALAEIMDCDLWTADERFFRAAAGQFSNLRWIGES